MSVFEGHSVAPVLQLASKSPRRRELLDQLQLQYREISADIDESIKPQESAEALVQRLAQEKALAGHGAATEQSLPSLPTLGADTVVVCGSAILGKPRDQVDAESMLMRLSGARHQVLTAVAMTDGEQVVSELCVSEVEFRKLEPSEIYAYWHTGEPADKAGAYGIQGLGAMFVSKLNGSYSGVMGLPIFETVKLLRRFGITVMG